MHLIMAITSSALVLFLAALGLYCLPLRLNFSYERVSGEESAMASVTLAGHWHFASSLLPPVTSLRSQEQGPQSSPRQASGLTAGLRSAWRTARRIERAWRRMVGKMAARADFSTIEWTTTIGCQDAASTALLTGSLWAVKGCFIGKWQQQLGHSPRTLKVKVTPDFQAPKSQTHFNCIAQLRCGHIIKASRPLVDEFIENRGEL